jgi:succinate dehydrogenase / fumarate reductase membrane anchor subunit
LLLFGWSVAFFYHLCSGVRHLVWDAGYGFEIRDAYRSGYAVLAATVVLTALAWLYREVAMANTRSLSNATALRDENVLRRVRHLGSARDGLQEWRLQRRTALALIPLGLYFVASMLWLATSDQMTAAAWLSSPVPALLTILFVLALLAHAVVGMRSVLVDYVHTRARLVAAELLVRGAAVVLGGASVLAVLKLFLGR